MANAPLTAGPAGDTRPDQRVEAGTTTFERASRLTRPAEFRRVFARPKVSQDRCFRVLSRANGQDRARLGLAVSVKVCKRATGRNRLKRLVRESFRHHQAQLAEHGGIDIVVLPSRHAATMCNKTLTKALAGHWRRCAEAAGATAARGHQGKN